jgi:coproporphyrinogen III oxidase
MTWRERTEAYFKGLQDKICETLSALDGTPFREDLWSREGGGGGRTRVLENGGLFEKAGVNFSSVTGNLPQEFADKIPRGTGTAFFATGISLVLHPASPMAPTVHANFRYLEKGDAAWFGGGMDLTPYYPRVEDAVHFHRTIKTACDLHDAIRASSSGATSIFSSSIGGKRAVSAESSSTTSTAIARRTSRS